jgi:hypothetical protein
LIGASVLIAAIAMLFTKRYPPGLFDLVLGINRWSYRLVVYLALMTDRYPPFRLDQGSTDIEGPPQPRCDQRALASRAAASVRVGGRARIGARPRS